MVVLIENGSSFIIQMDDGEFLHMQNEEPYYHAYAWSPDVFLRFMYYAKEFKGDPAPILAKVEALLREGRLGHSRADVLRKLDDPA
jgi:hypothetical protein